ncbi:MAG: SlyX family protein [Gammaproteobacteria bacterium]|nr:SlyX family protein [Gammaproteobacteria bacterium]
MDDDRLIEIETKLAHQEDLVNALNTVVTDQQAQIVRLEELCRVLTGRVRAMSESATVDGPEDDRPPHY